VNSTALKDKGGLELYRTQKEYSTKEKRYRERTRFLRILIGPIGRDRKLSVIS